MRRRMVAGVVTGAFAVSLGLLPAVSASATSVSTAPTHDRPQWCEDARQSHDWRWWNECCNRDWNDRPSWCWDDDHGTWSDPNHNRLDDRNDNRNDNLHHDDGNWYWNDSRNDGRTS
ncbi:hypothetical protein [Streptomyces sp. NRRL S-87]|uniref:hypothetical protein n=1 Tax=Streptomyces sp. NRRL S-87 TaxID=1463920 RepID=UPI00131C03BD|nr:hypothetical protein [Streptomyces sp. NRRL S-87]